MRQHECCGTGKPCYLGNLILLINGAFYRMITDISLQSPPETEQTLSAMLQAFDDLLFILAPDGMVLDFKMGNVNHLPAAPGDFQGRKVQEFFPPDVGIKIDHALEKIRSGGGNISIEYVIHAAGERRWYESRLVAAANRQIIMLARDATRHKQSEEKIKRQFGQLAALRSIDTAIASELDLHMLLSTILDHVRTQLSVDAASILLYDPQAKVLEFSAGAGFNSTALQHTRLRIGEEYAERAVEEQTVLYIDDLRSRPSAFAKSPSLGRENFIAYYAVPLFARGAPVGALEIFHRSLLECDQDWLNYMEILAGQAAVALDHAMLFKRLQRSNTELTLAYDKVIEGWSHALDLRNKETDEHSRRVTEMTVQLAQLMGVQQADLLHIRRGAMLHDIGKVAIPDDILLKAGPLTEEEWIIMRRHPLIAVELLAPIDYLAPALDIPRWHHEKWNGDGYPDQLSGKSIPRAARIFAVVDVFDALISDRPYRRGWPRDEALQYINDQSGIHFDPHVVPVFINMMRGQA